MSDQEWLAYLDTLPPDLADFAGHVMERINTLLNRERSQAISERQALDRQIAEQQTRIADLRTVVRDLFDRIAEPEQLKMKAVPNDASNDA